jgi:sulfatase modifying factor 1
MERSQVRSGRATRRGVGRRIAPLVGALALSSGCVVCPVSERRCVDDSSEATTLERPEPVERAMGPAGPSLGVRPRVRRTSDGAYMRLVRAARFRMGASRLDPTMFSDERPPHVVEISEAFYLDETEVSNAQFSRFAEATGYRTTAEVERSTRSGVFDDRMPRLGVRRDWRSSRDGYETLSAWEALPVTCVTHADAIAFSQWAGGALPTEAQFEMALREGGANDATFPWGETLLPSAGVGNLYDESCADAYPTSSIGAIRGYRDGFANLAPVRAFRPNALGVFDLSGNVSEYTADRYADDYYEHSPSRDPKGPEDGDRWVVRGGSCYSPVLELRSSARLDVWSGSWTDDIGFRLAAAASRVIEDGAGFTPAPH